MDNAPASQYVAGSADVESMRSVVLGLWRGSLGREQRLAAKYDWFYRHAPVAAPLLIALTHVASGAVVGVAAAGWRRMQWRGAEMRAGVLVDMTVLAAHRTLFPALLLQRELMKRAAGHCALLYGFPNDKAAPVFARVGYQRIGEMQRHAVALRSAAFLMRQLPRIVAGMVGAGADLLMGLGLRLRAPRGLRCEWTAAPWADIDAIWLQGPIPEGPVAVRDAQFVRWRCGAGPEGPMRFYIARDVVTAGPLAWLACETQDTVLHVRDWWTVDGSGPLLTALLRSLRIAARADGYRSLSLEYFGAPAIMRALGAAGFRVRDTRPVYAHGYELQTGGPAALAWHLTSADEDE